MVGTTKLGKVAKTGQVTATANRPQVPGITVGGTDLLEVLDNIRQEKDESDADFEYRLVHCTGDARNGLVAANAHRLVLGLRLLAREPVKRSGRRKWQIDEAAKLGIHDRHFRDYMAAARAIHDNRDVWAQRVPKENRDCHAILDRRFADVATCIKVVVAGGKPDDRRRRVGITDMEESARRVLLLKRFNRLVSDAEATGDGEWFRTEMTQVATGPAPAVLPPGEASTASRRGPAKAHASRKGTGVAGGSRATTASSAPLPDLSNLKPGTPLKILMGKYQGRVGKTIGKFDKTGYYVTLEPGREKYYARISRRGKAWDFVNP